VTPEPTPYVDYASTGHHTVTVSPTVTPVSNVNIESALDGYNQSLNGSSNTTVSDTTVDTGTNTTTYANGTIVSSGNITVNETGNESLKSPQTEFYRWVPYTYNGKRDVVMLTLNRTIYDQFMEKDSYCSNTLENCYHKYADDGYQTMVLQPLINDFKFNAPSKDEQALRAIRFVQSIPYNATKYYKDPMKWNYPYETLYDNGGVCADKSTLLVMLLRELGFATVIFHFGEEDHAAVGVKTNGTLGYAGTEYTFIETTTPCMIGYTNMSYNSTNGTMHLHTKPDVITMSSGDRMGLLANEEYMDARNLDRIESMGLELDKENYTEWQSLMNKYGM
jgi:hypothetical protein